MKEHEKEMILWSNHAMQESLAMAEYLRDAFSGDVLIFAFELNLLNISSILLWTITILDEF